MRHARFLLAAAVMALIHPAAADTPTSPPVAEPAAAPPPAAAPLTPEQKAAGETALKALRKLQAAIDVGVNFLDYGQRLIDATAEVKEAERKLPDGAVKDDIDASQESFRDARLLWADLIRFQYKTVLKLCPSFRLFDEYSLPWHQPHHRLGPDNVIQESDKQLWVGGIWLVAQARLRDAEERLSEKPHETPPAVKP